MLLAVALLLTIVGLVSAINAPAGPPRSNKADGYGGPVQPAPKNPKSVAACNRYYGAGNNSTTARDCRAQAHRNAALAKCNKKHGARRARQAAAVKACQAKYTSDLAALDPSAEDYDQKVDAAIQADNACIKKAQGTAGRSAGRSAGRAARAS